MCVIIVPNVNIIEAIIIIIDIKYQSIWTYVFLTPCFDTIWYGIILINIV